MGLLPQFRIEKERDQKLLLIEKPAVHIIDSVHDHRPRVCE